MSTSMIDYQRTIDNIRSVLASTGVVFDEFVAATAAEYAEACEAVNGRLRKCGQLLADGLRSEAIQQSDAEPNLLTLVATLDFPELSDWLELLAASGIQPPEPVLVDIAAELNEAYAREQPLTALLRRHRLLALSHGPLRDRIGVLRQLSGVDTNNPIWQDDLRDFERAHFQVLRRIFDEQCRRGDVTAVAELARDLQNGDWHEPPPAVLVQHVVQSHARLVRDRARADLERLEPELNDAFSQFDVDRGRSMREQWQASLALCDPAEIEVLQERAAPALDWLEEEDRKATAAAEYEAAVAALDHALDSETEFTELERIGHAVLRFERPIPPVMEQRLRSRLRNLETARSRRLRLIVSAVATAIILAVAGVGYGIFRQSHSQLVASHVRTLEDMLENGLIAEANEHHDSLSDSLPHVAADPAIQALGVKIAATVRDERERRARFDEWIGKAEQAGADQPDREALDHARELARTDSEKSRVLKLENVVADVDRQRQLQLDNQFLATLDSLNKRLDSLDQLNPDRERLAKILQELSALTKNATKISQPVLQQANVTRSRIERFYQRLTRRDKVLEAHELISSAIGDADSYKAALDNFVETFPESGEANDFTRVSGEVGIWKNVSAWNQFLATWREKAIGKLSATRAMELITACQEILRNHGGHPDAAQLSQRIPHLEAVARRDGEVRLELSLNELFTDPLIAGLSMVEVTEASGAVTRYYDVSRRSRPSEDQVLVRLQFIADYSRVAKKGKEVANRNITYWGPAPQSTIAKAALDDLARLNPEDWERTFFHIIANLTADKKLEPILKIILLQKVLEVACRGSESMNIAFGKFNAILASTAIDPAVPWMNPDDPDANRVRALAIDLLDRLPDVRDVGVIAVKQLQKFHSPLDQPRVWVGSLLRDASGAWQCLPQDKSRDDGELYVAQPSTSASSFNWTKVGHVQNGVVQLVGATTTAFVQGRPVFLLAFPSDSKTELPE